MCVCGKHGTQPSAFFHTSATASETARGYPPKHWTGQDLHLSFSFFKLTPIIQDPRGLGPWPTRPAFGCHGASPGIWLRSGTAGLGTARGAPRRARRFVAGDCWASLGRSGPPNVAATIASCKCFGGTPASPFKAAKLLFVAVNTCVKSNNR